VRVIEVRERGEEVVLVELGGEFDRHDLKDLRKTLDDVLTLRLPVVLDLFGVDFLDVEVTRELTIYSYLYAITWSFITPPGRYGRASRPAG
jgi:anti-anti-sigma regulatory factor